MNLSKFESERLATKRENLAKALEEMRSYAREHHGRFLVFGSATEPNTRFALHSDVDYLADFPDVRSSVRAWSHAEGILGRYGLRADGYPMFYCSDRFLDELRDNWIELA